MDRNTMQGLIFDFDGTLADTIPLCIVSFQKVFLKLEGKRLNDEEVVALFGVTEEGIIRRVVGDKWRDGVRLYLEEYERDHDSLSRLFPGISVLLHDLKRVGIRLAMVTGKGRESATISLRRFGLEGMFDAVEYGAADRPVKPEGIGRILEQWNLRPQDAGYIGDSAYDMQASGDAGVLPIGACWAETSEVRRLNRAQWPGVVFCERPEDVLSLVQGGKKRSQ